ncbi:hypothetical protein [Erythrobacter sp. EC-HK427]|uniref:hypothetical protein n=1 Tax=Erythrobacter sp. EC-HK427 TaxID=2038396 RepID=UPI001258BBAF|nr:hypothetical protein [Erythrobacter sp. EC-HK427]VVT12540.1 conserved exported hypothetical protein [Erythrobacter sp. EC-HK427]
MALVKFRLVGFAAFAGALVISAVPAQAAEVPATEGAAALTATLADSGVTGSEWNAYADPWTRRYRRRHDRRGVDLGDVVTGVLILGALATIVDATDGDDSRRDRRDRDYDRDYDYERDRDADRRSRDRNSDYESTGIANAADMCVEQVERGDARVDYVASARRTADGWRVEGVLTSGEGWNCWIDNDGRIRSVDFGGEDYSQGQASASAGTQWSDADYARARAATVTPAESEYTYRRGDAPLVPEEADGPQPAYPGGPLPGEEDYEASYEEGYETARADLD